MFLQIDKDHQRFRKIVKGKIRDDLRKVSYTRRAAGEEREEVHQHPRARD